MVAILDFSKGYILAVWRATGLKFGIQAYYPQIHYWDSFLNYDSRFWFFQEHTFQLIEELQGWNLEFKLITPKSITGTYFDTKLSRHGLAGLTMAATLDFQISLSQLFEELQGWNLEFKLITP